MTGVDITIVTYKGTGPLTNDLVGGHVAVGINTIPAAIGNIEAGRLRAIAVAAPARSAALPDVPTAAESGLPGFDAVQYYGLSAPAGIPRAIVERRALVSENAGDFSVLHRRWLERGRAHYGIVLTSSRRFPRRRQSPSPVLAALRALLRANPSEDAFRGQLVWLN